MILPSPHGEGLGMRCSNLLENIATSEAKAKGLDVADYMIAQLHSKLQLQYFEKDTIVKNSFTSVLEVFKEQSKPLTILIKGLELVVV